MIHYTCYTTTLICPGDNAHICQVSLDEVCHTEHHFTAGEAVRDLVIGMSDGLPVPFALAADLSGAIDSIRLVLTAALAEIAAGSIAMGLGGYLAAARKGIGGRRNCLGDKRAARSAPCERAASVGPERRFMASGQWGNTISETKVDFLSQQNFILERKNLRW